MLIETRKDLLAAAKMVAVGEIAATEIQFAEYITDTIKIHSEKWGTSTTFDVKTAQYAIAIQKDVIGVYNFITNGNASLKNIDKVDFINVKFELEGGCVVIKSLLKGAFFKKILGTNLDGLNKFTKDMSPNKKIATLVLILAITGTAALPFILSFIEKDKALTALMENNKMLVEAVAENQRAPRVIINYLGNEVVSFEDKIPYDVEAVKESIVKRSKAEKDIPPVFVDDEFVIIRYDFEKLSLFLSHMSGQSFWASTEWLPQERRERLKEATSASIDNKTAIICQVNVTCKIENGRILSAIVEGIDMPKREGSTTLSKAMNKKPPRASSVQTSLLD